MRLLVTADTIGGVWTYTQELVTALIRQGHEIVLVSLGNIPTPEQSEWMDGLPRLDFRPTAFRLEWMQEFQNDHCESAAYLENVIDETRPDILHLNQYCYGALRSDIPKIVVAHSDVVSWWRAVHAHDPHVGWIDRYREIVSRGIHGADCIVGVTHWMLDQVRDIYGEPRSSTVVYNGRSPSLFLPTITKTEQALSAGRLWDEGKHARLLAAIDPPMPIIVAGEEGHPDAISSNDLTGQNAFQFIGPQTHARMCALYARSSIYVSTSRYEPFGLAPLEAALSGCALVLNDITPLREIWGDAAVYFERDSAIGLQEQLQRLQGDRELQSRYGKLALARAKSQFTAERMAAQYSAIYGSLIAKKAAAA